MDPTPAEQRPPLPDIHPAIARVLAASPDEPRGVWFPANFGDSPKIGRLSDAAFRLWATGIDFCSRQLTNGVIPREVVVRLAGGRVRKKILDELLEVIEPYGSVWEPDPAGHGYRVCDYLDWNPSRIEVQLAEVAIRDGLVVDDDGIPVRWLGKGEPR